MPLLYYAKHSFMKLHITFPNNLEIIKNDFRGKLNIRFNAVDVNNIKFFYASGAKVSLSQK